MGVAGGLRPDDWSQRGAGVGWGGGWRGKHEGWGGHNRHRKYHGGQERLARGKRLFNDQSCGSRSGERFGNRFCTSRNHRQHDPARADRNRYEPRGWSAFRRHQKSRPAQTVGEGRGGRLHGRIRRQSRGKLRYWSGFERRWRISSLVRYANLQAMLAQFGTSVPAPRYRNQAGARAPKSIELQNQKRGLTKNDRNEHKK